MQYFNIVGGSYFRGVLHYRDWVRARCGNGVCRYCYGAYGFIEKCLIEFESELQVYRRVHKYSLHSAQET